MPFDTVGTDPAVIKLSEQILDFPLALVILMPSRKSLAGL